MTKSSAPRVLGVIPARGGSKRVTRKNLRLICGKPLIQYTIEAAQKATKLTTWVVSTEDEEIRDVALSLGAYVIRRPDELAQDDTTTGAVLKHALEWMETDTDPYDMVVCLHPTSPIRDPRHIDEAIDLLTESNHWGLASVCALPWKRHGNIGRVVPAFPSQLYFPIAHVQSYWTNASIYIVKRDWLLETEKHFEREAIAYVMDRFHSLDIDEEIDLKIAELYLQAAT